MAKKGAEFGVTDLRNGNNKWRVKSYCGGNFE
jgi:hypothetical protein